MHPIFSEKGDYPDIVKNVINRNSEKEGFKWSRLPEFSNEEKEIVRGTVLKGYIE